MSYLTILGLVSLLGLLFQLVSDNDRRRRFQLPPGPKPLWWLGNIWTFRKLNTSPSATCIELASKWGEMTTVWVGSCPAILINNPQAAHDLLHKHASATLSRPMHNRFRYESLPSRIVVTPAGEVLRRLRRIYAIWLQPGKLGMYQQHQEEESRELLSQLLREPKNFRFECDRYSINMLFRAIYGTRLGSSENELVRSMFKVWETVYLYFLPGTLPFDYFPSLLRLPAWAQVWRGIVSRLKEEEVLLHAPALDASLKSMETNPSTLASLLYKSKESCEMSRQTKIDILAMLLGAGSDTTSAVLQIFFKIAALWPEETKRAQREIDSVIGLHRLPTWEDEKNIPYVRSYIKEIQRWAPIAPIGIPHAVVDTLIYKKFIIPPGTILIPNIASIHQDPNLYPNPQNFDPSRFHKPIAIGEEKISDSHRERDHYHFGFGRRHCPGSHIAEAALYIAIVRILWAFDIGVPQGSSAPRMEEQRCGLLRKPLPFSVDITPRKHITLNVIGKNSLTQ